MAGVGLVGRHVRMGQGLGPRLGDLQVNKSEQVCGPVSPVIAH